MAVMTPGSITHVYYPQQVKIYDVSIGQLLSVASIKPSLSV